jgi:hypothetical protein
MRLSLPTPRCVRCQYDLSGLRKNAACPECALPDALAHANNSSLQAPQFREAIHDALSTIADCFSAQLVAFPLLIAIGGLAMGTSTWLGVVLLACASLLSSFLALRIRREQQVVLIVHRRHSAQRGVTIYTVLERSILLVALAYGALAALLLFARATYLLKPSEPMVGACVVLALAVGWSCQAVYLAALAGVLRDFLVWAHRADNARKLATRA